MSTIASTRIWSSYQEDIYSFVETGKGSAVIEACAGSGKTTTLVEAANRLGDWADGVCVAFNKRIADELTKRLPNTIPAMTLNAAGYRSWKRFTDKSVPVDAHKVSDLVRGMTGDQNPEYKKGVTKLVGLAKMAGIVPTYVQMETQPLRPDTPDTWQGLIEEYGVGFGWGDKDKEGIELARRVLAEGIRTCSESIDFNDQLYLPVVFGADFVKFGIVFCDELQDLSSIQFTMVERSLVKGGRFVGFGDRAQSLYFFRGAIDAMPLAVERFSAVTLPLSICYRCAKSIVRKAQEFVPTIQAFDGAEEGLVNENASWSEGSFLSTDAILCRYNAPLVKMAFRLIRAEKPCKVRGRDIGNGLVALIKRFRANSMDELRAKILAWQTGEIGKAVGRQDQIQSITDRAETLRVFVDNSRSPSECITKIEGLFADEAGQYLTLSSIHGSKGLEWPRVWLLEPELIGKRAETEREMQTERNCWYVAVTRAQKELRFIRSM